MGAATIATDALARLTDPEVRRFLGEKWPLIEEQFAPTHFILFGSRVNGTPHEWSDIDAIVVSERFAPIRGFLASAPVGQRARVLAALRRDPRVRYAERNVRFHADQTPDVSL